MRYLGAVAVVLLMSAVGCTSFTATPGRGKGIPIYPARPYLVVRTGERIEKQVTEEPAVDKDGKVIGTKKVTKPVVIDRTTTSYEVVYLPDLRRPYGISMSAFLGKVESSIKVEEGWRLSSSDTTVETKAAETINAVARLLPGALPPYKARESLFAPLLPPTDELPPPTVQPLVIYEFVLGEDGKSMRLNQVYPFE